MSIKAIDFKLQFARKGKLDKDGKGVLQIVAYKDNQRWVLSTGEHIAPEQWDIEKQSIKKHKDRVPLTISINNTLAKLRDLEQRNRYENQEFGVSELKRLWLNQDVGGFIAFAENRLEKETNLDSATRSKYKRSITKFKEFAGGEVNFKDLDIKLAKGFNDSLVCAGLQGTTRRKELQILGKYAIEAIDEGLLEPNANPFPKINISVKPSNRKALDESELLAVESLSFAKAQKHLEVIRDLFLMQCYTGLRFSDASRLAMQHIAETKEGLEIRIMAEKTDKQAEIPLRFLFPAEGQEMSRPEALIMKYSREDNLPLFLSDRTQQKVGANNQYTNRELKVIAELAGITKNLTNHLGRHTFATFLVWRVPLPIVKELLQHSKIETTMQYVNVGSQRVKEQLRKVKDWL